MLTRLMVAVLLAQASVAHAQDDPPVYTVPADGTPLVIEGGLEDGDSEQNDGTFYDSYRIQAPPGTLMVQLNSAAFDPFVFLMGFDPQGDIVRLGENDDGPADEDFRLNAFLESTLSDHRTLTVVANSATVGTGPYRLALAIRPGGDRAELVGQASQALRSGMAAYRAHDLRGAERAFIASLDAYRRLFPGDHADMAASLNNLAVVRRALGRAGEAEPLYEQALAMSQRLFPGDHADVASSLNNLAVVRRALGRAGEAEPLYEQALAMSQRSSPATTPMWRQA